MILRNLQRKLMLFVLSILLFTKTNFAKQMNLIPNEINEICRNEDFINKVIKEGFVFSNIPYSISYYSYKINYKSRGERKLTFCGIPIIDVLAYYDKPSYAFYVIIDEKYDLLDCIQKEYGKPYADATVKMDTAESQARYYHWDTQGIKIYLKKMRRYKNLSGCYLVILGNLNYSELVYFKGSN